MRNITFTPFTEKQLTLAAPLLAARHRKEREILPELPCLYEAPEQALQVLQEEWEKPATTGVAAWNAEQGLVGYMIGSMELNDTYRGRSGFVRYPGFAVSETLGEVDSRRLIQHLYSQLTDEWVQKGCFNHFVFCPAGDPQTVDAWLKTGFTYQQAYGILDLDRVREDGERASSALRFRKGIESDKGWLGREAAEWITLHQAQAPAWSPVLPERMEDIRQGYAGLVDDPEGTLWIAVQEERPMGLFCYFPTEPSMTTPTESVELLVASVRPTERGTGIGHGLCQYTFPLQREHGYRYISTDWHLPNLLSSQFWPKQGFRSHTYRLVRFVDPRISWAHGR